MKRMALAIGSALLFLSLQIAAQKTQNSSQSSSQQPPNTAKTAAPETAPDDYSGMYSFLQEGEFVQLTVEDDGSVTGFVSRYGDQPSDQGAFLNQFFKKAKLDGNKLTFTTQTVHGIWYEFSGSIDRTADKKPGDDGYYVMKGSLTQFTAGPNNKNTSKVRAVAFKSFSPDTDSSPDAP
jgi:hypothetical protein